MTDSGVIRVLLVDDQPLFRRAIAALLSDQPDFEVVGQGDNGLAGVELARELDPDVIVMDVEMPVMNGVEAAKIILEQMPHQRVVMLTVSEVDEHLMPAVELGVHGYLLKDLRPEQLYDMLRSVMRGQTPVSPALVGRLLAELRSSGSAAAPARAAMRTGVSPAADTPGPEQQLSQRELEILRLVADGLTNKEIGKALVITEGTVKNHVHNALRKLGMENRIQAAAYIVRQGLGRPQRD